MVTVRHHWPSRALAGVIALPLHPEPRRRGMALARKERACRWDLGGWNGRRFFEAAPSVATGRPSLQGWWRLRGIMKWPVAVGVRTAPASADDIGTGTLEALRAGFADPPHDLVPDRPARPLRRKAPPTLSTPTSPPGPGTHRQGTAAESRVGKEGVSTW